MPLEKRLQGKRVAIFAEDLYEDLELWYPLLRLREEGAEVVVVGPGGATGHRGKYGYSVAVDKPISEVDAEQFDALVVPGGYAPDRMRRHAGMVALVREMAQRGKIVAAICHGPWMLASAEVVAGKNVTCFFAIKDDLVHAGATYQDAEVVVGRQPHYLPAARRPAGLSGRHHCRPGGRGAVPRLSAELVWRAARSLVGHPWDRPWDIFRGDSVDFVIWQ